MCEEKCSAFVQIHPGDTIRTSGIILNDRLGALLFFYALSDSDSKKVTNLNNARLEHGSRSGEHFF